MKAAEYWKRRTVDLEHLLQARTTATMVEVNRMYAQGVEQLNEQIERILRRYVKNGQISQAYALQLLSAGQTAEERQRLLEQLQQTKEPQARRELIAMLDAPAYADRISRLQALQNAIRAEAVAMGVREERLAKARLTDTLKQAYYRTIFNDQKRNGLYDFRLISDRRVQAALTHKWSGKNYSDRVWKNNAAFCKRLQRTIEVGCMTGMTLHDMEERLLEDCIGADSDSGQRYCASRLIRTEVNHFSNQGFLEGYKAAGIIRYRFMATLDLRTSAICRQLDKPKNIHLHLDLIAGLPYEDLESFGRSFDTVMQIRPQQMQLGFLKVLKGSLMEQKAPEYGLEYSRRPPFTFIRTRWLDYPQLLQLKEMESVVEDYYNSGLFGNQIEWMISQEASPFSFFLDFGAWKVEHQLHLIPQGIAERCTTLWDYYFSRYPERAEQEGLLHDLCLFDLCLHTKPQKLPERVTTQANLPYREAIRALFRDEAQLRCLFGEENFLQHSRQAHLQVFSFDPQTRQPRLCAMLFDYHRRDLLGRAKVTDVSELIL